MKKIIENLILTTVLAIVLSAFLPWWAIMVAGLLSGAIVRLRNVAAFFVPFLAISLFWIVYAYMLSSANDFTLATKIATLLKLNGNVVLLLIVTGIVGGLAGGISALLGNSISAVLAKEK